MWYCFRQIRQDMELAADEEVLSMLEAEEHKSYGRTLITILEGFAGPRLAPRLLAMADDKKGIEKRIKMIRMAEVFKVRRRFVLLIGLLCIVLLSGILLTNGVTGKEVLHKGIGIYNAGELLKHRTEYVGGHVQVAGIMHKMPYGGNIKQIVLQTKSKPYDVTVSYEFKSNKPDQELLQEQFYNSAAIAFALIRNVNTICFKLLPSETKWIYTREKFDHMNVDLWSCSQNADTFEGFLQDLVFKVYVSPLKYSLAMSSTPGINIIERYQGDAEISKVRYSTQTGTLSSWEPPIGKVSQGESSIELPRGKGIYWSPLSKGNDLMQSPEGIVTVTLLNKEGKEIISRHIKIVKNGFSYEVQRSA